MFFLFLFILIYLAGENKEIKTMPTIRKKFVPLGIYVRTCQLYYKIDSHTYVHFYHFHKFQFLILDFIFFSKINSNYSNLEKWQKPGVLLALAVLSRFQKFIAYLKTSAIVNQTSLKMSNKKY